VAFAGFLIDSVDLVMRLDGRCLYQTKKSISPSKTLTQKMERARNSSQHQLMQCILAKKPMKLPISTHEIAISIHQTALRIFFGANKLEQKHAEVLMKQIQPYAHIQYVDIEEGTYLTKLLKCGVLKKTKKPGRERHVLNKEMVFAEYEPRMEWFFSLSDKERDEYEKCEVIELVDPAKVYKINRK
jgi:hypothetical protein